MKKCVEKLGVFVIFEKMNPREICGIKNRLIWVSSHEEIKEWNEGKKIDRKEREKTLKFHKNRVIYYLNLNSNTTRRKIREKTHNLTQNYTQNDSIHRQMKAFHSKFQKK